MAPDIDVTQLLRVWTGGNRAALDALMPAVTDELKRIARAYLALETHAPALQTTELLNEAYLRLVKVRPYAWSNRGEFFAMSARIMRRILVDHSRMRLADRRGGGAATVAIGMAQRAELDGARSMTELDEALIDLEKMDARKSRIVELRIFGGLTNEEAAEALDTSVRTVIRDWQFAKAWLARQLNYDVRAMG